MDRKSPQGLESTTTLNRGLPVSAPVVMAREPSEERAFAAGELVAGRYRVERFIARGGMGEVYAAEDLSLNERVALKAIRPTLAATPEALLRFKRELRLARRVTHANVCRVFDIGEHGAPSPLLFFTMELLVGRTLHEYLVQQGRLPPEQVLRLAEQMAAALDAAHAAQIVHRDFKSGNVMLVPTAAAPGGVRAVVTDFGLARGEVLQEDGSVSQESYFQGSPAYMSPEQVEGRPLSLASDLYSFGVVLFPLSTTCLRMSCMAGKSVPTSCQPRLL